MAAASGFETERKWAMNDAVTAVAESGLDGSAAACLERARALIPALAAAAPRIEAATGLPDDVVDALHDAGMFRLLLPRTIGGFELSPAAYARCIEALATGDASAAWVVNQASGCAMTAAYVAPAVAREIWGGRGVLSWGNGPGTKARAVRAEGGWRVTGTYSFASGSRHATWLGAAAPCFEADGAPVLRPDGRPWERTMLFPRHLADVVPDAWKVMGLNGTGSDTFHVTDLFVDDAHAVTRESPDERRETGTLYRFQSMQLYAGGFCSVALGGARALFDAVLTLVKGKTQVGVAEALRDNDAVRSALGYWDAALKAARAGMLGVMEEVWDEVAATGVLTIDQRVAVRQATTYAIHRSRDAAYAIFHEAGSTAILADQPFERRLRDVSSVGQHLQGRRTHFETVGHYMLGGEPSLRWL
jgi:alkylation response protein AidB-like acyl-CoA dehydrogenase